MDRILVGAPISVEKDYAFDEYLAAFKTFTCDDFELDLVLCDNSEDGGEYATLLGELNQFKVLRSEKSNENIMFTVNNAWREILKYAGENGYEYIMSIESDVICPPVTVEYLMWVMDEFDAAVVAHSVPHTGVRKDFLTIALGCTLFRLSNDYQCNGKDIFEGEVFQKPKVDGRVVLQIDNVLNIKHLDSRHYGR